MESVPQDADAAQHLHQPPPSQDETTTRTARQSKRLSLTFPILSPNHVLDRQGSPSPGYSTTAQSSGRSSPAKVGPAQASPVDSTGFLTSLAAQERKVLELKEELQRAENDLVKLKKQWAQYEAGKKRSEINRVEKLQIVTKPVEETIAEEDGTPSRRDSLRQERPARRSQQRVFSGSRHTRALSLLSPTTPSGRLSEPAPLREVLSQGEVVNSVDTAAVQNPSSANPSQLDVTTFTKTYKDLAARRSLPPPTRDALVKTGKQMATDLREGLWTFFEDIRHATVGEEGINATDNRSSHLAQSQPGRPNLKAGQSSSSLTRKSRSKEQLAKANSLDRNSSTSSRNSKKDSEQKSNDSFWKEFGLETPEQKRLQTPSLQPTKMQASGLRGGGLGTSSNQGSPAADDEHWDMWDSPIAVPSQTPTTNRRETTLRHSSSTVASQGASDSYAASGRISHTSSRTSTR